MNIIRMLLMILLFQTVLISCEKVTGKGDVVSQVRAITGFHGISLSMDGTVNFTPDSVFYVEISAQQNILDVLETPVENGKLVIRYRKDVVVGKHESIVITVRAPDVSSMNISGSGNISVPATWDNYYMEATISGSGNIEIGGLNGNEFHAGISGSGNITANSGVLNYEYLNISGSGNINTLQVGTDTVYATISGSGDISVFANKLLDATISGSGNIKYQGNPVVVTRISGSGNVVRL